MRRRQWISDRFCQVVWKLFVQSGITFHSVWLTFKYTKGVEMA
jgi:hypothetical protein